MLESCPEINMPLMYENDSEFYENRKVRDVSNSSFVFTITVLTMNRASSLNRLLMSLENAVYRHGRVRLVIKVDRDAGNGPVLEVARMFVFSHGPKSIQVSKTKLGLRQSWFEAWEPQSAEEYGIILEDDVEVCKQWHNWAILAWNAYQNRNDIGGLSLQRQTNKMLRPHSTSWKSPTKDGPFLYKLLGSIGFLPHPGHWASFLRWIRTTDLDTFDPTKYGQLPLLQTSEWFRTVSPTSWWEAWYIFYCEKHNLYTLYMHPSTNTALATHWKERGEHFSGRDKKDFDLVTETELIFPHTLKKYGWDGKREYVHWEEYKVVGLPKTLLRAAKKNTVTATMTTDANDKLVQNFLHYAPTSVVFSPRDVTTIPNAKFHVPTPIIQSVSGQWGQSNFWKINAVKPILIFKVLMLGYHVTWSDRDVVIKKPLEFPDNDCDIFASVEDGPMCMGSRDYSCAGFLHFRNTPQTINFVFEWAKTSLCTKNVNEQCTFQRLATENSLAKICSLDKNLYANGHRWVFSHCNKNKNCMTQSMIDNSTMIHANYLVGSEAKIFALKSVGLWSTK